MVFALIHSWRAYWQSLLRHVYPSTIDTRQPSLVRDYSSPPAHLYLLPLHISAPLFDSTNSPPVLHVFDVPRIDLILAGRYPPYSLEKSKMMIKMSTPSLPPRPAFLNGKANGTANGGDAKKRWGKWFLFVLALALSSGGVLMQMKVLNMNMNGSGLLAALRGRLMGIGGK